MAAARVIPRVGAVLPRLTGDKTGRARFVITRATTRAFVPTRRARQDKPCGPDSSIEVINGPPSKVQDGQVQDGRVLDRQVQDGRVLDRQVQDGQVQDGQVQDGQVQDGQVQDGQVQDDVVQSDVEPGVVRRVDGRSEERHQPPKRKEGSAHGAPRRDYGTFRRVAKILPSTPGAHYKDPTAWGVRTKPGDRGHSDPWVVTLFHPEAANNTKLDRHWLRDRCPCPKCVDPVSGQKKFSVADIPHVLPIEAAEKTEEGDLKVSWAKDFHEPDGGTHTSVYPAKSIDTYFTKVDADNSRHRVKAGTILWDRDMFSKDRLTLDFDEWMAGDSGLDSGLAQLGTHGLLFIRNVPKSEDAVVSIGLRIGNLQETLYGRTWDVRCKADAENVAYTNAHLCLHQDLLYTREPPRLQLLHCLENTCQGGESRFSDGARAHVMIRAGPARHREALYKRLIRYEYETNGHHYAEYRAVFPGGKVWKFAWSPPFMGKEKMMRVTPTEYRGWVSAAKVWRELLEKEHWVYEHRLEEGECVIFDNMRVVHGRKKFDAGTGSRWLKGAYISNDVFDSINHVRSGQIRAAAKTPDLEEIDDQVNMLVKKWNVWPTERLVPSGPDGWRGGAVGGAPEKIHLE